MNARLASALALALLATGCVDNRASIQIDAICVPTDTCTFASTCDAQLIGYPTLDVGASPNDAMWLLLQVENQLPNNADVEIGRVNTNDAHVDETVIEYEGPALPQAIVGSQFSVPAGGSAVISVQVIPAILGAGPALQAYAPGALEREMIARVRLRGYYDNGARFETGEFPITIRVCAAGCVGTVCGGLPTCPPDSEGQVPVECITSP